MSANAKPKINCKKGQNLSISPFNAGPSGETWTHGLLTPSQARYQLRHTRMLISLNRLPHLPPDCKPKFQNVGSRPLCKDSAPCNLIIPCARSGKAAKPGRQFSEIDGYVLWKKLWKLWITISSGKLLLELCQLNRRKIGGVKHRKQNFSTELSSIFRGAGGERMRRYCEYFYESVAANTFCITRW